MHPHVIFAVRVFERACTSCGLTTGQDLRSRSLGIATAQGECIRVCLLSPYVQVETRYKALVTHDATPGASGRECGSLSV